MKRMLLITAGVLIIAAALMIWDAALLRDAAQTVRDSQSGTKEEDTFSGISAGIITDGTTNNDPNGLQASQEDSNTKTILRSEPIPVKGNTPEYEIKLTLCQDDSQKIFLRLEYFHDGIGTVKELDEEQLPEISTFYIISTSSQHDVLNAEAFKQAILNPVYGQLYLLIQGGMEDEITKASFYRIDLVDTSLHKLSTYPVRYGEMAFNRDFSMLAYSFDDPSHMSVYQEDKLLEVYDCKAGGFVVKGSRDGDSRPIGVNHVEEYLYDYEFVAWESPNVVRLRQGIRKITDPDVEPAVSEVLYDVRKNLLVGSDGGDWKITQDFEKEAGGAGTEGSGQQESNGDSQGENAGAADADLGADAQVNPADDQTVKDGQKASEPAMVLKAFYTYLQSEEDYDKAMKLLDDKFKLRIAMLRQFGVEELSKNDIDAQYDQNSVSLYSNLLKAAKLDTIAKETRIDDNTVVITYYHNLGISSDSQLRQLMSAKLVQVDTEYKIVLIEDGIQ